MAQRTVDNSRIIIKNGKEENWLLIEDFIPYKGEPIIYNPDETHDYPRLKIGDGVHLPRDLPFVPMGSIPGFDPNNIVAKRVEHKLTFGVHEYDGSADVNVPIYMGNYSNH